VSEERDPTKLADEMDKQADEMQERAEEFGGDVANVRQDWQQKQGAADVPGANPADLGADDSDEEVDDDESAEEEASREGSPAPEAPPEEEGPASAEMASEGAAGPPADSDSDSDGDGSSDD
jgi:hypothetical protein